MSGELYNLQAYFDRIGYHGKADVSYETLYELHTAHTFNIPFENLDICLDRPPKLDKESLFKKLVSDRRGGYCFEMNGLFSIVLKELGFKVTDLLAGGRLHQIMMVELEGKKYLADVGYGNDGIAGPLLIEEDAEQQQFTNTYRFTSNPAFGYMLQRKAGDEYQPMYTFTLQECNFMDYLISNHFTATYPESFFRKMKFCTMPTPEGRITLTDGHLKITANGEVTERPLSGEEEFNALLKEHFGLDMEKIKNNA